MADANKRPVHPFKLHCRLEAQQALANDPKAFRVLVWVSRNTRPVDYPKDVWERRLHIKSHTMSAKLKKLVDLGMIHDVNGYWEIRKDYNGYDKHWVFASNAIASFTLGLSGREMQIYAHIVSVCGLSREFYESSATVAKFFSCKQQTVLDALKLFVELGLLSKTRRYNSSCIYILDRNWDPNNDACTARIQKSRDRLEALANKTTERIQKLRQR